MHYHLEIILPPTEDIEKAIAEILQQFDENEEENTNSFWDWYQIGGRYTGCHDEYEPTKDPKNLKSSGKVKWPTQWVKYVGDITTVDNIREDLTAYSVIVAGLNHDKTKYKANFLIQQKIWNGVNHCEVNWDGRVTTAIQKWAEKISHYNPEWIKKNSIGETWLCVTVDYHC